MDEFSYHMAEFMCLKSDCHLPKKLLFASLKALKLMKNAFYFILKAFSFSRYLSFCHDFSVILEKKA